MPAEPTYGVGDVGEGAVVLQGQGLSYSPTYVLPQAAPAPAALYQLPPDIADFTDREAVLDELRAALGQAGTSAVVVSAIAGKPGVGKSAVAVHLAHELAGGFPDAQLYADLRGPHAQRRPPAEVLAGFLHALAVPAEAIPEPLAERAALYRSLLAGKRALVVLDNAATEEQVRPLLPGSPTCAVLITSRAELAGLEAAESLALEVLEPAAAVELLGRVAGVERLAGQAATAQEIARLCGYLPLAVRIAGAKLRRKRHWRPATLAERLANERRRLTELKAGDLEVRASFALSYQDLDATAARAFRLLGLLTGPDFAAPVTAVLLESDLEVAEGLLEHLVDAQLLEPAGEGRFRFHDLLRLFAQERLRAEEPQAAQQAALERTLRWYLEAAQAAAALLGALGGSRAAAALGWLEAERASLVAAVEQADAAERWELAWRLASALVGFFSLRGYWADWQHTHELAVAAARRAGNHQAEAGTLGNLAIVYQNQGRWPDAISHHEQALALFHEFGDRHGEAQTSMNLGSVYLDQGRWAEAIGRYEQALALFHELGDRHGEAQTLGSLGNVYQGKGHWADAISHHEQALATFHELGDRHNEALTLANLGLVYKSQGDRADAHTYWHQALAILEALGAPEATQVKAWLEE